MIKHTGNPDTDLSVDEILLRLAEIEGIEIIIKNGIPLTCGSYSSVWNPRERWQDLGPLIYKHGIDINQSSDGSGYAMTYIDETDTCFCVDFDSESGLKLAACLTIIKKNEKNNK